VFQHSGRTIIEGFDTPEQLTVAFMERLGGRVKRLEIFEVSGGPGIGSAVEKLVCV